MLDWINRLAKRRPAHPRLRLLQAELNAGVAFACLQQAHPKRAAAHYRIAQQAALAALERTDPVLALAMETAKHERLTAVLDQRSGRQAPRGVPAVFWWAFARGAQANLERQNVRLLADLRRVDLAMAWVLRHRPGYANAGAHLYFGLRYVSLPPALGGRPERGRFHFRAVQEHTGGRHLLAAVLFAQHYAPTLAATPKGASVPEIRAAQRRAWNAWFGPLERVLRTPTDVWPEQAFLNALAKERALELLRNPHANGIIPPPGVRNPWASPTPSTPDSDSEAWDE